MPKEITKKRVSRGIKTDFDGVVFYTTMLLVFIGIIMVFSASFIQSKFKLDDSYYFLKRNLIYAVLGFIAMMFTAKLDYRFWDKNSRKLGIGVIVLLILVLLLIMIVNWVIMFMFQSEHIWQAL